MNTVSFVLAVVSVLIASFSQILLKKGADRHQAGLCREYLNIFVILGYGLFVLTTLITILALKDLELTYLPAIEALGYVFVMILSYFILQEKITLRKIIGNFIIVVGILITVLF